MPTVFQGSAWAVTALALAVLVVLTAMAVVIDEAVELAKSLSTDDSASFVHGLLAKVLADKVELAP